MESLSQATSSIWGEIRNRIGMKFYTFYNSGDEWFGGFGAKGVKCSIFPIDFRCRP